MEPQYNGWLVSKNLFKRSLAVFGHSIVGQLLIAVPVLILFVVVALGTGMADRLTGKLGKTTDTQYQAGNMQKPLTLERKTEGTISALENGWSRYTTAEWKGFSFSYPSDWVLKEKAYTRYDSEDLGELATVLAVGKDYSVSFSTVGKDFPVGVDTKITEYVVSGHTVVRYEEDEYPGFFAILKECNGVGVMLQSPTGGQEIVDKIISSIQCPSE